MGLPALPIIGAVLGGFALSTLPGCLGGREEDEADPVRRVPTPASPPGPYPEIYALAHVLEEITAHNNVASFSAVERDAIIANLHRGAEEVLGSIVINSDEEEAQDAYSALWTSLDKAYGHLRQLGFFAYTQGETEIVMLRARLDAARDISVFQESFEARTDKRQAAVVTMILNGLAERLLQAFYIEPPNERGLAARHQSAVEAGEISPLETFQEPLLLEDLRRKNSDAFVHRLLEDETVWRAMDAYMRYWEAYLEACKACDKAFSFEARRRLLHVNLSSPRYRALREEAPEASISELLTAAKADFLEEEHQRANEARDVEYLEMINTAIDALLTEQGVEVRQAVSEAKPSPPEPPAPEQSVYRPPRKPTPPPARAKKTPGSILSIPGGAFDREERKKTPGVDVRISGSPKGHRIEEAEGGSCPDLRSQVTLPSSWLYPSLSYHMEKRALFEEYRAAIVELRSLGECTGGQVLGVEERAELDVNFRRSHNAILREARSSIDLWNDSYKELKDHGPLSIKVDLDHSLLELHTLHAELCALLDGVHDLEDDVGLLRSAFSDDTHAFAPSSLLSERMAPDTARRTLLKQTIGNVFLDATDIYDGFYRGERRPKSLLTLAVIYYWIKTDSEYAGAWQPALRRAEDILEDGGKGIGRSALRQVKPLLDRVQR